MEGKGLAFLVLFSCQAISRILEGWGLCHSEGTGGVGLVRSLYFCAVALTPDDCSRSRVGGSRPGALRVPGASHIEGNSFGGL